MKVIGRKTVSLFCVLALILSFGAVALAAAGAQDAAEALFTLGVLRGVGTNADGTPDFALDKSATRGEAVTEIVRLMGKETEALSGNYGIPFTDVPDWVRAYVGYGYVNEIVKGYSAEAFGTDDPVTAAQYLTLLLRAMGYIDGTDFNWAAAYVLSDRLGITAGEITASNAAAISGFTRGNMAVFTLNALAKPVKAGTHGATETAPKTLLKSLLDDGAVTRAAIDAAGLDDALKTGGAESTPGGVSGPGAGYPAAPTLSGAYSVDGVNYALLDVPGGSDGYTYEIGGTAAAASRVLGKSGASLYKVELPAGSSGGTLTAVYNGTQRASYDVTFTAAGAAAPKTLYGVVPMKFSEFFHDVTGDKVPDAPDTTVFAQGGTVAVPELFIAQGTRSGNLGTPTYAQAKELPLVDVISSATFGDTSVHFVPDANLTNNGDRMHPDANFAVTGITNAEVGVSFDLYANAKLLDAAGQATAQSANVLAALRQFTLISTVTKTGAILGTNGQSVNNLGVYRVKYLLTDGNWGGRVSPTDGAAKTVKALPGGDAFSAEAETVTYGGTWGDKVTGYVIDNLETQYAGNDYWTNFANYFYGGYITDEDGNTEPLVILQNLFTHMAHTDFDIAVSPSRFARFGSLKPYGTYQVKILAWGFRDLDFEIALKDFINGSAALSGAASVQVPNTGSPLVLTVTGVDSFDAQSAVLNKGAAAVDTAGYSLSETAGTVTLTLAPSLLTGSYQGAYTLTLAADTSTVASKQISFTLINPARPLLTTDSGLSGGADGTQGSPFSVAQAAGVLYFDSADFAASLVTAGRSVSSVTPSGGGQAVAGAFKNGGAGTPYHIDLSVLTRGTTYAVTAISTGFNTQTYYITVT
ncbi:MAG: hypothetical protein LBL15_00955 [Oscillospiraceae bacterium]|jgi:hypothetical protein|nr:hypothetical protein [Oscillospiraceae bacterium]